MCHLANCDDAVKDLAAHLGWQDELNALVTNCGGWPPPGPVLQQISALQTQVLSLLALLVQKYRH